MSQARMTRESSPDRRLLAVRYNVEPHAIVPIPSRNTRTMKRALFIVVVVLIAGAYTAGYWPEHRRLRDAEAQVRTLQARLNTAEARIRLGEILGRLLHVSDAVAARNYGAAAELSSAYFDRVREETSRAEQPDVKHALDGILQSRDQVTTAL